MVDRDKIRDRMGDGDSTSSSNSSKSSSSSSRGSSSSSSNSGGVNIDKTSQEDKMEEFKKGAGIKDEVDTGEGSVPRGDLEEVLRAIANIFMFAEGKHRGIGEPDGRREINEKKAADSAFKEMSNKISEHEIQLICDKYGIDWEEDIIKDELQKHTGDGSRFEDKAGI